MKKAVFISSKRIRYFVFERISDRLFVIINRNQNSVNKSDCSQLFSDLLRAFRPAKSDRVIILTTVNTVRPITIDDGHL